MENAQLGSKPGGALVEGFSLTVSAETGKCLPGDTSGENSYCIKALQFNNLTTTCLWHSSCTVAL